MTTDLRHLLAIYVHAHQTGNSVPPHIDAEARAALDEADEPAAPAPPADGEVAELVEWLRSNALTVKKASGNPANGARQRMNRAAELLLQRQAPVPVSISERLPGPEDCDAEGRCWFGTPGCNVWGASWVLRKRSHQRNGITSWRPAHSLPLPEVGE